MRILALDVGERRIGVALSDGSEFLASPLTTIRSRGPASDVAEVLRVAAEHEAGEIVVGLPYSLSGGMGPQARLVASFIERLSASSPVAVTSWDERFSSLEAERLLRESGREPSRHRAKVDAAAAAVILQSYLDSKRAGGRDG